VAVIVVENIVGERLRYREKRKCEKATFRKGLKRIHRIWKAPMEGVAAITSGVLGQPTILNSAPRD
jgi:hypothetical protein